MTSMLDAKAMGPMLSKGKDNGPDAKSSLGLLNAAGLRTSRKIRFGSILSRNPDCFLTKQPSGS